MHLRPGSKRSGTGFDLPTKRSELTQLESQMAAADFWGNPDAAQSTVSRLSAVKSIVGPVDDITTEIEDLSELLELAVAESDQDELNQIEQDFATLTKRCETIELHGLL